MTKRPGAAAVTGGALLALLCPAVGSAAAQDTEAFPRAVSDGYATWNTADAEPADHGLSVDVTEPAVRGSADRASFPATSGSTDLETGAVDVEWGGAARFVPKAGPVQPLTLGALRLRLTDGDDGTLHARTVVDGRARVLTLADVTASGGGPALRAGGVTWTGLRASLTDEGAKLLSAWSGEPFARGDALGRLDVTVGTGSATPAEPTDSATPSPSTPAPQQPKQTAPDASPSARVRVEELTAGGQQTVDGTGFEPGEIILVAIDGDTRYQAVADEQGRAARTFPVYDTAAEGVHTVALYTVTGGRSAVAEFAVRLNSGS